MTALTPPFFLAYAACLATMLAVDLVWLGWIAKPLYQRGIGHLMIDHPRLPAAAAFYPLFALGLMVFVVAPHQGDDWAPTALAGAFFGLVAYATYDLTNLATLRGWPVGLSLIDMTWGSAVSAVSAAAGQAVLGRMAA